MKGLNKTLLVIITTILLLSLVSQLLIGKPNSGLTIVVTFPSLVYDIKQLLAKDDKVISITPPGADPHHYQLTTEDVEVLKKADLIISTAHTPFEINIRKLKLEGEIKAVLIEIPNIKGIKLLKNPMLNQYNYHMPTYDPNNYKIFIKYIASVLEKLRPSYAVYYHSQALKIIERVNNIIKSTRVINVSAVADLPFTEYAVSWTGIKIKFLIIKEHGVYATPRDLKEIENAMKNGIIKIAVITYPVVTPASKMLKDLANKYNIPIIYVYSPLSLNSTISKLLFVSRQINSLRTTGGINIAKKKISSFIIFYLLPLSFLIALVLYKLRKLTLKETIIITLIIGLVGVLSIKAEPRWILVLFSAALAYGCLSSIVAARRLYFLAGASAHSALLSVTLAIPLSRVLPLMNEYLWAIIIGLLLIYSIGYLIHKGIDPDTATATFVAFTASASIIAIYLVLTRFPIQTDIMSIIIGDPLLASWYEAYLALIVSIITLLTVIVTYREQISLGIDRDAVLLSGVKVLVYDIILFTLLALTTVALIKVVGFVLEHVLILLPAAIGSTLASSSKDAMFISITGSILSSLLGLLLSIFLDLAPAGITGLILMTVYIFILIIKRRR